MLESKMAHLLSVSVFEIRFVFAGAHQNSHISPIKSEKSVSLKPPQVFLQNNDILNEVQLKLLQIMTRANLFYWSF